MPQEPIGKDSINRAAPEGQMISSASSSSRRSNQAISVAASASSLYFPHSLKIVSAKRTPCASCNTLARSSSVTKRELVQLAIPPRKWSLQGLHQNPSTALAFIVIGPPLMAIPPLRQGDMAHDGIRKIGAIGPLRSACRVIGVAVGLKDTAVDAHEDVHVGRDDVKEHAAVDVHPR